MDFIIMQMQKIHEKENPYESFDVDIDELEDLIKDNHGYLYNFSYSDENSSWGSEMEHGGTFDKLPHIRTSHH
jgi:hypothetical protein